jgi:DNA-directed RNA polymerase alpha subunit
LKKIQIINPNQYIATVAVNSNIEMEFLVQSGKNYRLVNSVNSNNYPPDFLQLDAVFMPVRKVTYEVTSSETNALENNGSIQNNENLTLEIWTNGSISPIKALVFSTSILENLAAQLLLNGLKFCQVDSSGENILDFSKVEEQAGWKIITPNKRKLQCNEFIPLHSLSATDRLELTKYVNKPSNIDFNLISESNINYKDNSQFEEKMEEKVDDISSNERNLSQIPIEELILSARAYNGLKRAKIDSVADLLQYSIKDLKEIKNFGKKSLDEVVASLKNLLDISLI